MNKEKKFFQNDVGLIIHGPFDKKTNSLINNAKCFFNIENIVYLTPDYLNKDINLGVKVVKPNDPGGILFLGRKGINLIRHVNNIKHGCDLLSSCNYIFKIRSDLNMSKINFLELHKNYNNNSTKILRLKSYTSLIPWYHNDFLIGAPYKVMIGFSNIILYDLKKFFKIIIYNEYRYNRFSQFILNPEICISICLYLSYYNLKIDEVFENNLLTNYELSKSGLGAFKFVKLSNVLSLYPSRLSIFSIWSLKLRMKILIRYSIIYWYKKVITKIMFYVR